MRLLPFAIIALPCIILSERISAQEHTKQQEAAVLQYSGKQADTRVIDSLSGTSHVKFKTHIVYDSTLDEMILVRLPADSSSVIDSLYSRNRAKSQPSKPLNLDRPKPVGKKSYALG